MHLALKILLMAACVLVTLAGLAFLGLRIPPRPLAAYPAQGPALQTVPLPQGLPAPVDRFYRTIMGERIPVVESAILTGRGHIVLNGLRMAARARFTHDAGQGYRHYIETMFFGRPLMKVNEWYLDGHARLELPMGVVENDPKTDMAANLGLWAESMMLPSVFLTDPRVRWEPIDETHARLVVPFGEGTDSFTVTFDAETGLVQHMEAMRWKDSASPEKVLWRCEARNWKQMQGALVPTTIAATWANDKEAWLVLSLDELVLNADVATYIRASGP